MYLFMKACLNIIVFDAFLLGSEMENEDSGKILQKQILRIWNVLL